MADPMVLRRYPGTKRFGEDPNWQTLFYGRDREAEEFFNEVLDRGVFSVLHGVTGSGKSSFIRAGLGAEFQRRNIVPIYLDANKLLGASNTEAATLLDSIFVKVVTRLEKRTSSKDILAEIKQIREQDDIRQLSTRLISRNLFRKLLNGELGEKNDNAKVLRREFVIFLDQYDHMADKSAEQQNMLLDIIHGIHDAADSEFSASHNLRSMILVVRSEYLRLLVPLSSRVPGVFNHIFELHPISIEAVRECIVGPARRDQFLPDGRNYLTPHWSFDDKLVEYIIDQATSKTGERRVELLDLQRICSDIEDAQHRNYSRTIKLAGSLKATIDEGRRRYLRSSIQKAYKKYYGRSWWWRRALQKNSLFYTDLCQQQRRRSIAEDVFLNKLGNNEKAKKFIDYLCSAEMRILARLDDGVNIPRLSYTHDLLAETAETLRFKIPSKGFVGFLVSGFLIMVLVLFGLGAQQFAQEQLKEIETQKQQLEQATDSVEKFMRFSRDSLVQTKRLNNKLLLNRDFNYVSANSLPVSEISLGDFADDPDVKDLLEEIRDIGVVAQYQNKFANYMVGEDVVNASTQSIGSDCSGEMGVTDSVCEDYIKTTWADKKDPTGKLMGAIQRAGFVVNSMHKLFELDDTVTVLNDLVYMVAKDQKRVGENSQSNSDLSEKRKYVFEYAVSQGEGDSVRRVVSRPVRFMNQRGTLEPNSLAAYQDYLVIGANGGEILFCKVKQAVCNQAVSYRHGNDEISQIHILKLSPNGRDFLITMDSEGEIRASLIAQTYAGDFIQSKPIFTIYTDHTIGAQLFFHVDESGKPVFKVINENRIPYQLPFNLPSEFFNGPLGDENTKSNTSYYAATFSATADSIYFGRSEGVANDETVQPLSIHWWKDEGQKIRQAQKPIYQLPVSDEAEAGSNSEKPWRMTSFSRLNTTYIAMVTNRGRLVLCEVLNTEGDDLRCEDLLLDQSVNPALLGSALHDVVWDETKNALLIGSFDSQIIRVSFENSALKLRLKGVSEEVAGEVSEAVSVPVNVSSISCSAEELAAQSTPRKVTAISLEPGTGQIAVALRALTPQQRPDFIKSKIDKMDWDENSNEATSWNNLAKQNCLMVAPLEWVNEQLDNDTLIQNDAGGASLLAKFIQRQDMSVKTISWLGDNQLAYAGLDNLEVVSTDPAQETVYFDLSQLNQRTYWKVKKVGDFLFALHSYGVDIWHLKTGELAVNYAYPIEDAAFVKLFNRTVDFDVKCSAQSCRIAVPMRELGLLVVNVPRPD